MSSSLGRVRKMIANHRPGRGRRYPSDVKREVMSYAAARRDQGASWAAIADELGLCFDTVRCWGAAEPASSSIVQVEVVDDEPDAGEVVIVSPSGFRLEGLDLASATAVLKALR